LKLTVRSYYSIKALLDLSLQPKLGVTSVTAIARRQDLPAPYLEKLLIDLRRAGLVKSIRGAQGGYKLARSAATISLKDIFTAVGEVMEFPLPIESTGTIAADWVARSVSQRLQEKMQTALAGISLADLYYDARSWQAAQGESQNFVI
jgi:Rrf2 family protein